MSHSKTRSNSLFPLGASLGAIAAGFGLAGLASAQTAAPAPAAAASQPETVMPVVRATATAEPQGKSGVQATTTRIGKANQELRDVPQSVTVVTEKLIDDRNLDTLKDVLRSTSGVTFLAAEGGEEDIRLRGFPLQATGDVFVDGMRDPAFYERDTFFYDRVEILRGSASMLFGRGSTGGAVNQVSKVPRLLDEKQVDVTVGNHRYLRTVGDFNFKVGESSAARLGTMTTEADNNGAGSSISKAGMAGTYRTGIGFKDEFSVGLYLLENNNGMNYGMPYIRPDATATVDKTTLLPLDPGAYYGMASDYNFGRATHLTATHTHRFDNRSELVTTLRRGAYERDQRAGTVRFSAATAQPDGQAVTLATFGPSTVIMRGTQLKIQDLDTLFGQSDYSGKFNFGGMRHELQAGIDYASEKKVVYGQRTAVQGGVVPTKPTTTVGTPSDGATVDEASRVLRTTSDYKSTGTGVYVQDLLQIADKLKLLAGLRYDILVGDYNTYAIPTTAAGPVTTTSYRMKISELSKRAGLLFQPNELSSYHLSAATSFNTSGDAYSLSAANVDVPPESAINVEAGAKVDWSGGNLTTGFAVFRATKLHERNTDPLVNLVTLSGKRHVAGIEVNVAGRITPQWEFFTSYTWLPIAKIDEAAEGSEGRGTRPSLTPRNSVSLWSTYQITTAMRVGAGLTGRSSQTPNRNPGFAVPSFTTVDLMAEYAVIRDKVLFKANITNVGNKLYADSLYTSHYIPGAGRLLQLTGTFKF